MNLVLDAISRALEAILLQLATLLPRILFAVAIVIVGLIIGNVVRRTIFRAVQRAKLGRHGETLDTVLSQLAFGAILTAAGIVALGVAGIDVTSLVAGLGLTSLAIGFALRDILENTISGLLILFSRAYVVGDIIRVTDQEGVVSDISLRATTIKSVDGIETLIPNRLVYGNILQNRTAYPVLRRTLEFRLDDGTAAGDVCARATIAAAGASGVLTDPPPAAEAVMNADGLPRLRLHYWVPSRNPDPELGTRLIAAVSGALHEL